MPSFAPRGCNATAITRLGRMPAVSRIHWGLIVVAGLLSELAVLVVFFVLLIVAKLAGVAALASPMSPLESESESNLGSSFTVH